MQRLSSNRTIFYKFAFPSGLFVAASFCIWNPRAGILEASVFTIALVFSAWFASYLKKVHLERDSFRIASVFGDAHVPQSHLKRFEVYSWHTPQFIALDFDPPTRWGARIIIITPIEETGNVSEELSAVIERNLAEMAPNHSPDPTPAPGMPPAGQESRHG